MKFISVHKLFYFFSVLSLRNWRICRTDGNIACHYAADFPAGIYQEAAVIINIHSFAGIIIIAENHAHLFAKSHG